MPALSRFYPGLLPWHIDRMTVREINEYQVYMERVQAEIERQNKQQG